jgi:hypothetical protein
LALSHLSSVIFGPAANFLLEFLNPLVSISTKQSYKKIGYLSSGAMGFGDFTWICEEVQLPLCSVIGSFSQVSGNFGIEADCYARNIELANTIIFQGAASFCHIAALVMTTIMIIHVRSKFTAVGMLGAIRAGELLMLIYK